MDMLCPVLYRSLGLSCLTHLLQVPLIRTAELGLHWLVAYQVQSRYLSQRLPLILVGGYSTNKSLLACSSAVKVNSLITDETTGTVFLQIYIYIYMYKMDCVCQRYHKECSTRTCADDCYNCPLLKGFFCDLWITQRILFFYLQTAWRLVLSMKPWSYIWLEFGLFSTIIYIYMYIYIYYLGDLFRDVMYYVAEA